METDRFQVVPRRAWFGVQCQVPTKLQLSHAVGAQGMPE